MQALNRFECPCHGSQYNAEGKVTRGPAPLSLALAHADVGDNGTVYFSPWYVVLSVTARCLLSSGPG